MPDPKVTPSDASTANARRQSSLVNREFIHRWHRLALTADADLNAARHRPDVLDIHTGATYSAAQMLASHDLDSLNPAQREAVRYGEMKSGGGVTAGPLLVIAGAGTGKTSTLAHRVAHLLLAGVPAERVLLLTFTRRAALEMTRRAQQAVASTVARGRTGRALPAALRLPWSGTFHAIGNRLIRLHAERLGLDPGFSVLDRSDAADLMDVVRQRLGLRRPRSVFRARTPASRSTRIASTRNCRCAARWSSCFPGASSGRTRSRRSAASTSTPSSRSSSSTTTTCCSTGS